MMTMLTATVALLWLAMGVAGATPAGRRLRAALVDGPAALLSAIDRRRALVFLLVFGGTGLVAWALGHEAARGFAMILPELTSWTTLIEVTAYLDLLAAIVTTASVTRVGALRAWVMRFVRPRRDTGRAPRRHAARPAANDDEDSRWERRCAA